MEFFYRFLRPLVELGLPGAGSSSYQSIISSVQKLAGEFPGVPREFLRVTQHAQHVQGLCPCPQLHFNYSSCVNWECTCMYPPGAWRQECWEDQEVLQRPADAWAFPGVPCSARLTSRLCPLVGTDAFCFSCWAAMFTSYYKVLFLPWKIKYTELTVTRTTLQQGSLCYLPLSYLQQQVLFEPVVS